MTVATFAERTRLVVKDYLRSALLIDDQLTIPPRSDSASDAQPVGSGAADDGLGEDLPLVVRPSEEELGVPRTGDVRVTELVRAFGRQGIACATLEPRGENADILTSLAVRVDIVIVDWDIVGEDAGKLALELIPRLSQAGGRRVVAVYTQDPSPDKAYDRIAALAGAEASPPVDGVARIKLPGVTVRVLSKPNAGTSSLPGGVYTIVDEAKLPGVLIDEFAAEVGGILANAALRGLAAVRDAAPRALAALGADLDAGYLVHRLLLRAPADAEEQARLLVADEIAGLLEISELEREVGMPVIEAWLAEQQFAASGYPNDRWVTVFKDVISEPQVRLEALLMALREGVADDVWQDGYLGNMGKLFGRDTDSGRRSNHQFAHRMTLRAKYGNGPRVLTLGTVVEADGQYYVCVQPACDAVRISRKRKFPLLRLRKASGDAESDLIILDGEVRRLAWKLRYDAIELQPFEPDKAREMVVEQETAEGPRFVADGNRPYRWVGELREAHALRLTNQLAAGLSRVGLIESEWLRRLGAKRAGAT